MIKANESMSTDKSAALSPIEQRLCDILQNIQNSRRYSKEDKAMYIGERCASALIDPFRLPLERVEIIRDKVTKGA